MDKSTQAISKYIKDNGITITHVAKKTDIPYYILLQSLSPTSKHKRNLRGDELLKICKALGIEEPLGLLN